MGVKGVKREGVRVTGMIRGRVRGVRRDKKGQSIQSGQSVY